jgi:hypothetical protein
MQVLLSSCKSCHCDLAFFLIKANPDVWIREAVRDNGFDYYEMLIIYVDDMLSLSHQAKERIDKITMHALLILPAKKGSIKEPTLYLGANVGKMQLEDGWEVWYTSS